MNVSVRVSVVPSGFVTWMTRVPVPSGLTWVAISFSALLPFGPVTVVSRVVAPGPVLLTELLTVET